MRVAASSPAWFTRSCHLELGRESFDSCKGFAAGIKLTAEDKKSRCSWVSGLRFFGGCSVGEACLYDDVVENARDAVRIDGHEHILRAGLARHRA